MNCPNESQLLLYLEKELATEESLQIKSHLESCRDCSLKLAKVQQTLDFTCRQMHCLTNSMTETNFHGQEQVWNNLRRQMSKNKKEVNLMKIRKMAVAAAVVLALVMVGSIPSVQTAAANFLKVFRVENVQTLTLGPNDMAQIEQALNQGGTNLNLDNFGNIQSEGKPEETRLDYSELGSLGFSIKLPANVDLPTGEYSLQKVPALKITPDVDKINQLITSLGSDCLLPPSLNGQTFQIKMGDSLVASYKDFRLIQCSTPELEVPGDVEAAEVAKSLIALPIWPDNVRRQLESVSDWENTILIPGENLEKVTINGQDAVLMNNNNQLIWQESGTLFILEGQSNQDIDLVAIAKSLR
ncbi:MAG: zf-HC2 domain-containing protein [Syntrophomonas sp.]